jgi:hypothetical protein
MAGPVLMLAAGACTTTEPATPTPATTTMTELPQLDASALATGSIVDLGSFPDETAATAALRAATVPTGSHGLAIVEGRGALAIDAQGTLYTVPGSAPAGSGNVQRPPSRPGA